VIRRIRPLSQDLDSLGLFLKWKWRFRQRHLMTEMNPFIPSWSTEKFGIQLRTVKSLSRILHLCFPYFHQQIPRDKQGCLRSKIQAILRNFFSRDQKISSTTHKSEKSGNLCLHFYPSTRKRSFIL